MGYDLSNATHVSPRGYGRALKTMSMSPYEARQLAEQLLRRGTYKGKIRNAIELLATTGVMLEDPLLELAGIKSSRTLRRYRYWGYLDLLVPAPQLGRLLGQHVVHPWTLGPVGLALAERLPGLTPKGYVDAKTDRVTHDALCSLVCYHISQTLRAQGYQVELHSKYEATIHGSKGQPLLEPDTLIGAVSPQGEKRVFLIEYHNEDFGTRVREKVDKYEAVLDAKEESFWRDVWHLPEGMPTILAIWTYDIVGKTYETYVREQTAKAGTWGMYMGRSLASFLAADAPPTWTLLNFGRPANLLEKLPRN